MRKHLFRFYSRHGAVLRRVGLRTFHVCWYGAAAVVGLLAVVFVLARFLLPMLTDRKADLEALLSRESGYDIRIARLEDHWDGLYPGLRVQGISVREKGTERAAVQLQEARISLQILPLFWGAVYIHSGVLVRPNIALERLSDGGFHIQGLTAVDQVDSAQADIFMSWLFQQKNLSIEDGQLQWFDWREPGRVFKMTGVNLQLRNRGDRHRLGIAAKFPADICGSCSAAVDVEGNPLLGQPFDGEFYALAREVNVERLPLVIREHLPMKLQGVFSAELWSEWKKSVPVHVEGGLSVAGLRFSLAGLRAPLSVKQASTALRWDARKNGFGVTLRDLTLALHGRPWSAGTLKFMRDGDETSIDVDRIELADITAFIADARPTAEPADSTPHEAAAIWNALRPAGVIKDLRAHLEGRLDAPDEYTLAADLEDLAAQPYKSWPGLSGVDGVLWAKDDEGRIKLDIRAGALALPEVFRAPLPITRADAEVRWQRAGDQWVFTSENIVFRNEDMQAAGRLLLRLPLDPARSPYLGLHMDFREGNGAHVARYYPAHKLSPELVKWMDFAFAGGILTRGSLVYDGETRNFPFNGGEGKFEIRATARDGIYRYLEGWEPVRGVSAEVHVNGDHFLVTGNGRIGALKAADIMVRGVENGRVLVSTNVSGPVAESVRLLRAIEDDPEAVEWKTWLPGALDAEGNGTLSLHLAVDVHEHKTRMRGEYRFLDSALRLADKPFAANRVNGVLRFTEDGVSGGRVQAQLLGGEVTLDVSSPRANETVATLRGQATAIGLAPMLGAKFAPFVDGALPWQARLKFARGTTDISGEVALDRVKLAFPAPLNRPDGFAEKLVLRTETTARNEMIVAFNAGTLLQGRVRLQRQDGWSLTGGRVAFNETPTRTQEYLPLPTARGFHVLLWLDAFDLDRWRTLVADDAKGETSPAWLTRVSAATRDLTFLGRDFGDVNVELVREKNGWTGGVSGQASEGRLRIETAPATRIVLDFTHLRLPPPKSAEEATTADPRKLPYLSVKAKSFHLREKNLGELDFLAVPVAQGWKIERTVLTRPESRFEASGLWRLEYGQASSNFNARFTSRDTGQTLEALALPQQLDKTDSELTLRLAWNGAPTDVNAASLNGVVEVNAKDGSILNVDQGAARLFGVLDFSAIGRYLTLDFSPIFGKGFAFDRIGGTVTIEHGNAYMDNFSIKGPSARLAFGGRIGLAAEDFSLTMDVYPSLSESLTLGGFFAGGPQVALWTLIVSKLFKKQIEEGTRVTYLIHGPWDKPEIKRRLIERPTPESTTN